MVDGETVVDLSWLRAMLIGFGNVVGFGIIAQLRALIFSDVSQQSYLMCACVRLGVRDRALTTPDVLSG